MTGCVRVARERQLAAQALVEHRADRPDVAARVHVGVSLRLLRRHVPGRAEHDALARERRVLGQLLDLADTEVQDLRERRIRIAIDEEDVVGLEIAMNDARVVRTHEAAHDLHEDALRLGRIEQPFALDPLGQRLAAKQLHDDESDAVIGEAGVEDLHDVRALGGARGLGLAREPPSRLTLLGVLGIEDLDCHALLDGRVDGLVNAPHPATADQLHDRVFSDRAAGQIRQLLFGLFGLLGLAHRAAIVVERGRSGRPCLRFPAIPTRRCSTAPSTSIVRGRSRAQYAEQSSHSPRDQPRVHRQKLRRHFYLVGPPLRHLRPREGGAGNTGSSSRWPASTPSGRTWRSGRASRPCLMHRNRAPTPGTRSSPCRNGCPARSAVPSGFPRSMRAGSSSTRWSVPRSIATSCQVRAGLRRSWCAPVVRLRARSGSTGRRRTCPLLVGSARYSSVKIFSLFTQLRRPVVD